MSLLDGTRAGVRESVRETSWLIVIKFHLEYHWVGGLATLGFGLDRIRTLVSMATDSSHRVIKPCDHSSSFIFDWFFFIFAGNKDNHYILDGFKIRQDQTRDL